MVEITPTRDDMEFGEPIIRGPEKNSTIDLYFDLDQDPGWLDPPEITPDDRDQSPGESPTN